MQEKLKKKTLNQGEGVEGPGIQDVLRGWAGAASPDRAEPDQNPRQRLLHCAKRALGYGHGTETGNGYGYGVGAF